MDNKFINGLMAKAPHPNAPDFVIAKISIKRADLGNFLRGRTEEWINADLKRSKDGKYYIAEDTWSPDAQAPQQQAPAQQQAQPDFDDDVPF